MSTHEDSVYGIERLKIEYKSKGVINQLSNFLSELIKKNEKSGITLLCIGTDRSTGDCFAPMIGTMLSKKRNLNVQIIGTLDKPAHAKNLDDRIKEIKEGNLVIAIDACLGEAENIGKVIISNGKMKPGAGVGKELTEVGDISISAVVNMSVSKSIQFSLLQSTRLSEVWGMASVVTSSVTKSMKAINKDNETMVIDKIMKTA